MARLKIHLLGTPQVELDETPITFQRRKTLALIAYLAVTRQPHTRDALATLLWPGYSQTSARTTLRQTLNALKSALGEDWLDIDREAVTLRTDDDAWVDVHQFQQWAAEGQSQPRGSAANLSPLTQAIELYHGDFMAGFTLPDSPNFDEWQSFQTENLRHLAASLLERLVESEIAQTHFQQALPYAQLYLMMDSLNEAAHRYLMQLYACLDRRSDALRQYEECCRALGEMKIAPDPMTTRLYEDIKDGRMLPSQRTSAPGIDSSLLSVRLDNFPRPPTPFVRREKELTEIVRRLEDPECRLLTLVGIGGVGKTRLALQAASLLLERFPQGIHFVSLASESVPEFIVSTINQALNLQTASQQDPKKQLLNYLREKNLLLILDNFEHLLSGAELAAELLAGAPHIKLLVTSRERLNLLEEWLFEVHGMTLPQPGTLSPASEYDALELFARCAVRIQPRFSLSEDLEAVAEICQLVEGLPLGIELAASHVRTTSTRQIARQMQSNLDFLSTSLRNIPERHRSLRRVFEHSWNLLPEADQQVFMRLSVFRGSFTPEAARYAAQATDDILMDLVDKSLLRVNADGRYDIHEFLRQCAKEKLDQAEKIADVERQFGNYYLNMVNGLEPDLLNQNQIEAMNALSRDLPNLRAVLQWAIDHHNPEVALKICRILWQYWNVRGPLHEGRLWIDQSLSLGGAPELRADVLMGAGMLARRQGDYKAAGDYYEQSWALLRELDDKYGIALVLSDAGMIFLKQNDYASARAMFEEGLKLSLEIGNRSAQARALNNLGIAATEQGNYEEGHDFYEKSLALWRELGSLRDIATLIYNLAILAQDQDDLPQACELYLESLNLHRQLEARDRVADIQTNLAGIYLHLEEKAAARAALNEALKIRREFGERRGSAFTLITMGSFETNAGDYDLAFNHYAESLTIFHELNEPRNASYGLQALAELASRQGNLRRAARLLGAVDRLRSDIGFSLPPSDQASYDVNRGEIRDKMGESAFDALYQEGALMGWEAALNYALKDIVVR